MDNHQIRQKFIDRLYFIVEHKEGNVDIIDHEGTIRYYDSIQDAYERFKNILNINFMTDAKKPKDFIMTPEEMVEFDNDYSPNNAKMALLGFSIWKYKQALKGEPKAIKEFCKFLIEQIRYNNQSIVIHQENTIEIETLRGQEIATKITVLSVQLPFLNEEIDISFPRSLNDGVLKTYEMLDVESNHTKQDRMRLVLEYYLDHCKITLL